MFAIPTLTPLTRGCVAGAVCPAAMVTVDGDTLTFELSLLDSVTVTVDAAALGKVTVNCAVWPSGTLRLDGIPIGPGLSTVTFASA